MLDLSKNTKATKKDLIAYIQKEKGSKGLSSMKKEELRKFAQKVQRQNKKKTGGNYAPVNSSSCEDAYQGFAAVDAAFQNMTFRGGRKMKGGQQSSGQTFFPARYYNPDSPSPNPQTDMMSAYGPVNPVSGACRNLAPFPNTSRLKKGGKNKKNKKSKKEKGIIESIMGKTSNTFSKLKSMI